VFSHMSKKMFEELMLRDPDNYGTPEPAQGVHCEGLYDKPGPMTELLGLTLQCLKSDETKGVLDKVPTDVWMRATQMCIAEMLYWCYHWHKLKEAVDSDLIEASRLCPRCTYSHPSLKEDRECLERCEGVEDEVREEALRGT